MDEAVEESAGMNAGRVFALSDGVFAIAATLLALELRVPDGLDSTGLSVALRDLWPAVQGFFISYLVIGVLWLAHHRLFRRFHRITGPVMVLNVLLLGLIALLPFPSSLLARYADETVSVELYAADVAAVALLQVAMLAVAWRQRDIDRTRPAWTVFAPSAVTAVVFSSSGLIALLSPTAAMYSWLSLVPLQFVVGRLAGE
jgi:uncharacterized membrane protein